MRILVTGAGGLLGSKVTQLAHNRGHEVYSAYLSHEPDVGKKIKLDLMEEQSISESTKEILPECVIHCAALTNVDLCEENRKLAMKINLQGTKHIVKAAKHANAYLIFISTDYIFDGEHGNYAESDKPNPINCYGYSKLQAERAVLTGGERSLIIRPSVIYGSKPAGGKVNFALWVLEKLPRGEEMKVLADQYVSPTLNTNLASMILEACEKRLTGVYHMSGASRVSRYEFAVELASVFDLDSSQIRKVQMSEMSWLAKRPKDSSLSVSKASQTLREKPLELRGALKILREEVEGCSKE